MSTIRIIRRSIHHHNLAPSLVGDDAARIGCHNAFTRLSARLSPSIMIGARAVLCSPLIDLPIFSRMQRQSAGVVVVARLEQHRVGAIAQDDLNACVPLRLFEFDEKRFANPTFWLLADQMSRSARYMFDFVDILRCSNVHRLDEPEHEKCIRDIFLHCAVEYNLCSHGLS